MLKVVCNWNLTHASDKQIGSKPGAGVTNGMCPPGRVQFKAQGYRLKDAGSIADDLRDEQDATEGAAAFDARIRQE